MPVNAQPIAKLQVVHCRYRVERIAVLEVYGAIQRASNRLCSMIYDGKICFRLQLRQLLAQQQQRERKRTFTGASEMTQAGDHCSFTATLGLATVFTICE